MNPTNLFIWALIAAAWALFLVFRKRPWRVRVLLVLSVGLYLAMDPVLGAFVTGLALVAYLSSSTLHGLSKTRAKTRVALIVALLLSVLAYFKYTAFLWEQVSNLVNRFGYELIESPTIIAPLAISFITFQLIHYAVECYRGNIAERPPASHFFLYVFFFPYRTAGPIERFGNFKEELDNLGAPDQRDLVAGVTRILVGLFKKLAIADYLHLYQVTYLPNISNADEMSLLHAWLIAMCFTFRILFDFSGYSDLAVGLSRLFGIRIMENFNWPYLATSPQDFWRRWHISLSVWLRDYLYIPLGGNRVGRSRWALNIMIVFTLCGIWHGAGWNFVIWGAWHGAGLVAHRAIKKAWEAARLDNHVSSPLKVLAAWLGTFIFVSLGWLFFFLPAGQGLKVLLFCLGV